ncbi:MAG: hypothetical protein QME07_01235 [bacterium]|nr:hypothetical protein [bacterium]
MWLSTKGRYGLRAMLELATDGISRIGVIAILFYISAFYSFSFRVF